MLNRNDDNYDPLFAYGFGLTYQDTDTLGDDLDTSGGSGQPQVTFSVPGTIEAEQYAAMNGILTETSTDSGGGTGGGINIGWVDVGDWLEYNIDVETSGSYLIEYRLASSPLAVQDSEPWWMVLRLIASQYPIPVAGRTG